jgi:hypothetical protein
MFRKRLNYWWSSFSGSTQRLLLAVLLGVLAVVSLVSDQLGLHNQPSLVVSHHTSRFRKSIPAGVAISLNSLQKHAPKSGVLPGMSLMGVCWDRFGGDWVLFGETAPNRPGFPLDALILAFHATRAELDAPGVDIRAASTNTGEVLQKVSYYGGVESSVVGRWFFDFDYWMKRKSLGNDDAGFPEIPSYWEQASAEWAAETANQRDSSTTERHNRFWLQTEEFTAIEDGDVLTFQSAPLKVCQEAHSGSGGITTGPADNDPLAQAFADRLTTNLVRLSPTLPIDQIEDFARIIAGITWLAARDPHRDLGAWLSARPALVATRQSVPTLGRHAERTNEIGTPNGRTIQELSFTLSGGVLIRPRLTCFGSEDDELLRLETAILRARPLHPVLSWNFNYQSKHI